MTPNSDQFVWVEKYRPHKITDCILPDDLKNTFQNYVNQGNLTNLMLVGPPGTGKTTVAKALCEELGADWMFINGSSERGIDVLRGKISSYASSVSFTDGRKVVIIDEADNLTGDMQNAMKAAVEEFSSNCSFIYTANHANKLIAPLHSRCAVIEFRLKNGQKVKMATALLHRLEEILKLENVKFERSVLVEVIQKYFPDYRRTLNELQRYATEGGGVIDVGILSKLSDASIKELIGFLKDKDFNKMRKWVANNSDQDMTKIYRKVYDSLYDYLEPGSIPGAVVTIAEYSYRNGFVADPELNAVACFTNLMCDCSFK